jgi:hypothetical protein
MTYEAVQQSYRFKKNGTQKLPLYLRLTGFYITRVLLDARNCSTISSTSRQVSLGEGYSHQETMATDQVIRMSKSVKSLLDPSNKTSISV